MELFFKEKPTNALVKIRKTQRETFTREIAQEIETSYAHCCGIIKELEEDGYLKRKKIGRRKIIELTEEGKTLADKLIEAIEAV